MFLIFILSVPSRCELFINFVSHFVCEFSTFLALCSPGFVNFPDVRMLGRLDCLERRVVLPNWYLKMAIDGKYFPDTYNSKNLKQPKRGELQRRKTIKTEMTRLDGFHNPL